MDKNVNIVYENLRTGFKSHENPHRAKQMSAYMRNQFIFFGIPSPERKLLEKEFIKTAKNFDFHKLKLLTTYCWESKEREFQYSAMNLISRVASKLPEEAISLVEYLIIHKSWWDTVDFLASNVVGTFFKTYPDIKKVYIKRWRKSDDKWLRRTCILHQLKYKSSTDIDLLVSLILENRSDPDFFIQKSCGWALRQYSRINPDFVVRFAETTKGISKLAKTEALKWLKNSGKLT